MEASGPPDDPRRDEERRSRRTGILIGFLAAAVIGLGVALALVLADDDGGGGTVTTPTAKTVTETTETTVTTAPPTTATTSPGSSTITQPQAKAAAARGAAAQVERFGITLPPDDWDTRCTAVGGRASASTWSCLVAANGGQCSGSITAFARGPGVAATRDPLIGCGE